jgi:hypothetical protein
MVVMKLQRRLTRALASEWLLEADASRSHQTTAGAS